MDGNKLKMGIVYCVGCTHFRPFRIMCKCIFIQGQITKCTWEGVGGGVRCGNVKIIAFNEIYEVLVRL